MWYTLIKTTATTKGKKMEKMTKQEWKTLYQLIKYAEENHFGPVRGLDLDAKLYQLAPEGFTYTPDVENWEV